MVRDTVNAEAEETAQRFFGEQEDATRSEHALDVEEDTLDIHELAEHLASDHELDGAVAERQVDGVAGQANGRAGKLPSIHQSDAVAQRVGGEVEREAFAG